MLTHFSLFSGIGGIDLAAEWAGFTTVGFCEIDPFCQAVLRKHWPGVPIWSDVRDVTAESVRKAGIGAVDLVSGGFPCQPFSCAGKRRGKDDDRYLWPEMLRVIKEVRPTWVFGENVAGFANMGLDDALSDLEAEGYEKRSFIIPACGVEAPHERYRVWIVAHSASVECSTGAEEQRVLREMSRYWGRRDNTSGSSKAQSWKDVAYSTSQRRNTRRPEPAGQQGQSGIAFGGSDVADTGGKRLQESQQERQYERPVAKCGERPTQSGLGSLLDGLSSRLAGHRWPAPYGCEQYDWEPPRVTAGKVPYRRQKLQALGNAVVPQQAYPILAAIAEIEKERSRAGEQQKPRQTEIPPG